MGGECVRGDIKDPRTQKKGDRAGFLETQGQGDCPRPSVAEARGETVLEGINIYTPEGIKEKKRATASSSDSGDKCNDESNELWREGHLVNGRGVRARNIGRGESLALPKWKGPAGIQKG